MGSQELKMRMKYEPHEWEVAPVSDEWQWLAACAANTFSQFGEDGIVAAFFKKYEPHNRTCFEVGAADGVFFSNTLALRKSGWDAVLIEPDPEAYSRLLSFAGPNVKCVCDAVGPSGGKIDDILGRYQIPHDLDLGVIDIDGADYWAWHDMEKFRPRLMLVEFQQQPPGLDPPPKNAGMRQQAGEQAIAKLAIDKGYVPIVRTRVNLICVDGSVL